MGPLAFWLVSFNVVSRVDFEFGMIVGIEGYVIKSRKRCGVHYA